MEPIRRLLDHPFYQAWNRGEVTTEQLSRYGAAYLKFMAKIPEYWSKVGEGLGLEDDRLDAIVEDEKQHVALWKQWIALLPEVEDAPKLEDLFAELDAMTPSELAGALHAYEVQQEEVSEFKKASLVNHYGLPEEALGFFTEHIEEEEEHINFGKLIFKEHADAEAFEEGFKQGGESVYKSLDVFCVN